MKNLVAVLDGFGNHTIFNFQTNGCSTEAFNEAYISFSEGLGSFFEGDGRPFVGNSTASSYVLN